MNYRRKHFYKKFFFGLFGLLIIPAYGYLFGLNGPKGDLVIVTFSQIGSRYGAFESLIFWGILSSLYYFLFLNYLFTITGVKNNFLKVNLGLSSISLLLTVFLPFAPSMFPLAARTHNFLARIAAISSVATLLVFIAAYLKIDKTIFVKTIIAFSVFIALNLTILYVFGVSSLFQIVFTATLCPFLFYNLILLEKSKNFDIFAVLSAAEQTKKEEEDII